MHIMRYLSILALALLAALAFHSSPVNACMCSREHPQTAFCRADYVVVLRVLRKSSSIVPDKMVYKVEIKKTYKINSESHKMLKHGRIQTSISESTCGINLDIGKLYMIAARGPQLSLCSYVKEYLKMSLIERRGFAGSYRKGCKCDINMSYNEADSRNNTETETSCKWFVWNDCQTEHSACMKTQMRTSEGIVTKCHWRRTAAYKHCLLYRDQDP